MAETISSLGAQLCENGTVATKDNQVLIREKKYVLIRVRPPSMTALNPTSNSFLMNLTAKLDWIG